MVTTTLPTPGRRTRGRRTRALSAAAGALALALVATASPAGALPEWRTTATGQRSAHQVLVLDLRHAQHARFDRVVIDLRGVRPGYRIGYTDRLTYDGSGLPVRLAGRTKMALALNPAYAHDDGGNTVYEGPRRIRVGYPTLKAIAFTGDYEGYVSFGFGTSRRAPYRVFVLDSPKRLVIDWKH